MKKRVRIMLKGRVQGVFFRQGAKSEAQRLGVGGWVRNEPDGSVRLAAEGEEAKLGELIEWCRKGTEWSEVRYVKVEWGEAKGEFKNFEIL